MSEQIKAGVCIACHKDVFFLWKHQDETATNLDDAIDGELYGSYGSRHDTDRIRVIVCDDCVSKYLSVSPDCLTTREEWL
jgi:hypothetical protein